MSKEELTKNEKIKMWAVGELLRANKDRKGVTIDKILAIAPKLESYVKGKE